VNDVKYGLGKYEATFGKLSYMGGRGVRMSGQLAVYLLTGIVRLSTCPVLACPVLSMLHLVV